MEKKRVEFLKRLIEAPPSGVEAEGQKLIPKEVSVPNESSSRQE